MSQKRNIIHRPPSLEEEEIIERRSFVEPDTSKVFGFYSAQTSPLITPQTNLDLYNGSPPFLHRLYRYMEHDFRINIPETPRHWKPRTDRNSKIVTEHINSRMTIIFNGAYSPMINPIEEFFSKLKSLARKMPLSTEEELCTALLRSFNMFTEKDIRAYIRHMLFYAEESVYKRDFL